MRTLFIPLLLTPFSAAARGADDTPTADERATVAALAKLGGQAAVDASLPAEARVAVKFAAPTPATFAALKKYPHVGAVTVLDASKLTDGAYAGLKELPHLRKLVLNRPNATDKTFAALGGCKGLRVLAVVSGGVTDAEVGGLKALTRLESLDLSGNPKLSDKAMAVVKGLERLEALYLAETAVTDRGLAELKGLDGLRSLNLTGTKVTAAAAERFVDEMPNLRTIRR